MEGVAAVDLLALARLAVQEEQPAAGIAQREALAADEPQAAIDAARELVLGGVGKRVPGDERARLGQRLGQRQRGDARVLRGRQQEPRALVQELAQDLALVGIG